MRRRQSSVGGKEIVLIVLVPDLSLGTASLKYKLSCVVLSNRIL